MGEAVQSNNRLAAEQEFQCCETFRVKKDAMFRFAVITVLLVSPLGKQQSALYVLHLIIPIFSRFVYFYIFSTAHNLKRHKPQTNRASALDFKFSCGMYKTKWMHF